MPNDPTASPVLPDTQPTRASAYPATSSMPPRAIRGVYAVTPDDDDDRRLAARVDDCLHAGVRWIQYRNKTASPHTRRRQLERLAALCALHGAQLVVNDDWRLARDLGIAAVHLGRDDGDVARVRDALGPQAIIGVSCYASLDRARAVAPQADYLAFGSLFASPTKPAAPAAALELLGTARAFGRPVVGIGGITLANAGSAIRAGADAVAIISALFAAADIRAATRTLIGACTAALAARDAV